jgi:hypothetical protein
MRGLIVAYIYIHMHAYAYILVSVEFSDAGPDSGIRHTCEYRVVKIEASVQLPRSLAKLQQLIIITMYFSAAYSDPNKKARRQSVRLFIVCRVFTQWMSECLKGKT